MLRLFRAAVWVDNLDMRHAINFPMIVTVMVPEPLIKRGAILFVEFEMVTDVVPCIIVSGDIKVHVQGIESVNGIL